MGDCSIFYDESIHVLKEDDLVEFRFNKEDPIQITTSNKKRKRQLSNHVDSIIVYNDRQKNGKIDDQEKSDVPKPKKIKKKKITGDLDSDIVKTTKESKVGKGIEKSKHDSTDIQKIGKNKEESDNPMHKKKRKEKMRDKQAALHSEKVSTNENNKSE